MTKDLWESSNMVQDVIYARRRTGKAPRIEESVFQGLEELAANRTPSSIPGFGHVFHDYIWTSMWTSACLIEQDYTNTMHGQRGTGRV